MTQGLQSKYMYWICSNYQSKWNTENSRQKVARIKKMLWFRVIMHEHQNVALFLETVVSHFFPLNFCKPRVWIQNGSWSSKISEKLDIWRYV